MKLTAAIRKQSAASMFGLPQLKKYYIGDKSHAIDAEGRATQQVEAGNLTPMQKKMIDVRAHRVINKK